MGMYRIIFSRRAAKFIDALNKGLKNKIKEIMETLQKNPFAYPYRKIRGEPNLYRIRVGKYRILYEVNKVEGRIIIIKVDKRSRIYRR